MQAPRSLGNSLIEYGLIGAVLTVAGIGTLMLVGDDLVGWLQGLRNDMTQQVAANARNGAESGGNNPGVPGNGAPPVPTATGPDGTVDLRLTFGDGTTLNLNRYPVDLKQNILTSGANGTTDLLLANLQAIVDQRLREGKLTDEQKSILTRLANQGHRIGSIEKAVEDALAASGNDVAAFRNMTTTFDGKAMNVTELAGIIGYKPNDGVAGDQSQVAEFRSLFNQAVQLGALSDAASRDSVEVLVNQIANVANGVETGVYSMLFRDMPASEFRQSIVDWGLIERDDALSINTQKTLLELGAAEVTRQDANEICRTGSDAQGCTR